MATERRLRGRLDRAVERRAQLAPLAAGSAEQGRDGGAGARSDDDAARGRAGQLVLVARLEAELADVVADADLALRALDLLGRGRADGAQQRAGERLARRQLLGARHRLRALDRLDLLGQRGRVVGRAQGHRLDELLGTRPLGGAREGVAVDVQDAGQRGGARVDVLDRGAIEADPHHLAGGDERLALAIEDRRAGVGVADRPQAAPGGQPRVHDGRGPDDLPVPVAALESDPRAIRPGADPGHVPAQPHGRSRGVAALRDVLRAGPHAGPVEAAAVGRQRRPGRRWIAGQRRRAAIVAARPRSHERVERLARLRRRRPADEEDDDRRDGDQRQGAECDHARDSRIGPGHEGREARGRRRVQQSPRFRGVSVPAPHTMAPGMAPQTPIPAGVAGRVAA